MSTGEIEPVSLIIVNYNSSEKLTKLLRSLKYIKKIILEVIIIDNNSNDLKKLKFYGNKKIKLIRNNINIGFSKAVNQGIYLSKQNNILLLNPDCQLIDNTPISSYKILLSSKHIGAVGGKINNKNHKITYSATTCPTFLTGLFEFTNLKKIFPTNRYSRKFWIENNWQANNPIQVFSLCGAYIFFKKNGLISKNIFDSSYFLYLEDLEFGHTIKNNHQEIWFDPNSQIVHAGGSSNNSKYGIVLKHWYKSRKIYFNRHLSFLESRILSIIFSIEEVMLHAYHILPNLPND